MTDRVLREAQVLGAVTAAELPAPGLLAVSTKGEDTGGHPSIVMTRLRGQVSLSPADADSWLNGRAPVDTGGMTARVEEVLAATLQRL